MFGTRRDEKKARHKRKFRAQSRLRELLMRRNRNVAAVALANKNTYPVWAVLARGRDYRSDYTSAAV